jgi:hypothetical protein
MFIGDILLAHGLVSRADVAEALERQKREGGRLGDNLILMGKLKAADLETVMHGAPSAPQSIADTGIGLPDLLNLVVKTMYSIGVETPTQIAGHVKLPQRTVQLIMEQAQERKLFTVLGSAGTHSMSELRYALSEKGKQWARDAFDQNQYIGPAPVSLAAYRDRVLRQRITNERVDQAAVDRAFANIVISPELVRRIGPAINSGRSILLYGPPGNGKTSIAEKIGGIFSDIIYVPYCFDIEGQIIKVFDPSVHELAQASAAGSSKGSAIRREEYDQRWAACRRPFIVTGGELTLEMLDMSFNAQAKFYEAPLHIKALGGTFVIDDFGRQIVKPEALLNRWIVPMESRVEYLKLHTGKSFSLPFEELVVFSTNLQPSDLMDPAFLRRIPYKLEIGAPNRDEFRQIFRRVAEGSGVTAPDEVIEFILTSLREDNNFPLAGFQPKFILDQVAAICKYEGVAKELRPRFLEMALSNLHTKDTPGFGITSAARELSAAAAAAA